MQHPQPETGKLRIGVIFGGRSGEHEVSIASATSIIEHLDRDKYEIVPIAITQEGRWLFGVEPQRLLAAETGPEKGALLSESLAVTLPADPTVRHLVPLSQPETGTGAASAAGEAGRLDVIFPVLHGTYGEDGTLQGLLEMASVPYVGCGVLGSALGMDKEKMKMIFQVVGLPIVDYLVYRRHDWERDPAPIIATIEARLGYPCFVKPVNLGSSVGISKAHNREELEQAIAFAAEYDRKIIVERSVDCRELECAVLGNDEPLASVVGEIIPSNEFYDYRAKYIDNRSQIVIPADLPQALADQVRRYAVQAFLALDLSGLARVDFFLDRRSGQIYINEVNTMPGFTTISMYPKLWQASGLSYAELLDRLIELALERHADRQRNRTQLQL